MSKVLESIETYRANNSAKGQWLAVLTFGGFFANFHGSSEEEVVGKAKAWWTAEMAKSLKDTGKNFDTVAETKADDKDLPPWLRSDAKNWKRPREEMQEREGRGTSNLGKKWMRKDGSLERVPASEVENRLKEGWYFSGPRSK